MSSVPCGISALLYWISWVTCERSDVMFVCLECLVYLNKSDVLFTSLGCLVWYVRYLMYRLRYRMCSVECIMCQRRYLIWHGGILSDVWDVLYAIWENLFYKI